MKLRVLDESRWVAASKAGGTFADLHKAFQWRSAVDWPCPIPSNTGPVCDTDGMSWNGWCGYVKDATGWGGYGSVALDGKPLPPEIINYVAAMYVAWKMGVD